MPFLVVHFVEEFYFGLPAIDIYTASVSNYLNLSNDITYLFGQLILFIFLAIILTLILLHKNINLGAYTVGVILIFEFTHVLPAMSSLSYYPGIISGSALFVLGTWYWYKVIRIKFIESSQ